MNRIGILAVLALLVFGFVGEASAAVTTEGVAISSYSVELEVDADANVVHETIDIFFTATADTLSVIIDPEFDNLKVSLDGTDILCQTQTLETGAVELSCPLDRELRKRFLTIMYDTPYTLLSLQDNKLMLRYRYTPVYMAETTEITATLPEGYVIEDTARFIVPEPDTIYSDGRRIIVGWERGNLVESFGVSIIAAPLQTGSVFFWYLLLGSALVASVLFVTWRYGLFPFKRSGGKSTHVLPHAMNSETVNPLREIVYPDLLESEEKVVEALKANLGVLKQKDLVRITGFSKAKMSRLLRQMDSRNIIKSKPYGNSKKIYLLTEKEKQQLQQEKSTATNVTEEQGKVSS